MGEKNAGVGGWGGMRAWVGWGEIIGGERLGRGLRAEWVGTASRRVEHADRTERVAVGLGKQGHRSHSTYQERATAGPWHLLPPPALLPPPPHLEVHRLLALDHSDELCWHDAALVDQLVEGVLAVGA